MTHDFIIITSKNETITARIRLLREAIKQLGKAFLYPEKISSDSSK